MCSQVHVAVAGTGSAFTFGGRGCVFEIGAGVTRWLLSALGYTVILLILEEEVRARFADAARRGAGAVKALARATARLRVALRLCVA